MAKKHSEKDDAGEITPSTSPLAQELLAEAAGNTSAPHVAGKLDDEDGVQGDEGETGDSGAAAFIPPDPLAAFGVQGAGCSQGPTGFPSGFQGAKSEPCVPIIISGLIVEAGAPLPPEQDPDAGDKTKTFFVWACRYCELEGVIKRYAGRKIAGQGITQTIIEQIRASKA